MEPPTDIFSRAYAEKFGIPTRPQAPASLDEQEQAVLTRAADPNASEDLKQYARMLIQKNRIAREKFDDKNKVYESQLRQASMLNRLSQGADLEAEQKKRSAKQKQIGVPVGSMGLRLDLSKELDIKEWEGARQAVNRIFEFRDSAEGHPLGEAGWKEDQNMDHKMRYIHDKLLIKAEDATIGWKYGILDQGVSERQFMDEAKKSKIGPLFAGAWYRNAKLVNAKGQGSVDDLNSNPKGGSLNANMQQGSEFLGEGDRLRDPGQLGGTGRGLAEYLGGIMTMGGTKAYDALRTPYLEGQDALWKAVGVRDPKKDYRDIDNRSMPPLVGPIRFNKYKPRFK